MSNNFKLHHKIIILLTCSIYKSLFILSEEVYIIEERSVLIYIFKYITKSSNSNLFLILFPKKTDALIVAQPLAYHVVNGA
jgi:hypothetical protein